jgi:hypothetical protein
MADERRHDTFSEAGFFTTEIGDISQNARIMRPSDFSPLK